MTDPDASFSFLALGDSYTLGEGVDPFDAWPFQLRRLLRARDLVLEPPVLIARTGWTTGELAEAIEGAQLAGCFDLVSLSAGVNNQYRGLPLSDYRREFSSLLGTATALAGGLAERVLVPSIPDWSHSPYARASARHGDKTAREIDAYNAAMAELTRSAGAVWLDITDTTRGEAAADYAEDGLHPSARIYALWAQRMADPAARILSGPCPP